VLPEGGQRLKLSGEIRALLDAGHINDGLQAAREVYEAKKSTFSESARITGLALANLLEYATRMQCSLPDLKSSVIALEQHWEPTALGETRSSLQSASAISEQSGSPDKDSSCIQAVPTIMHILPRVCEYAAQCGRRDEEMRGLAERSLERLHTLYPYFDPASKTARYYAASTKIRAATHIVSWKVQEERPDLRALKYMAKCGRDHVAHFSEHSARFYYSLFELESGDLRAGLQSLEALTTLSGSENTDVRIASLDQFTGWCIRVKDFAKARISCRSLREELDRDYADENWAVRSNERVKTVEFARLNSHERALARATEERHS
jgi:hypothetical protein